MEELFSELLKEKKQNLEAQCVELESQNKKTLMFQREPASSVSRLEIQWSWAKIVK